MSYHDDEFLTKCMNCGVPAKECTRPGRDRPLLTSDKDWDWKWVCYDCLKAGDIYCSHCDKAVGDDKLLPEPLDDGSYLCEECDKKLVEELNEFIPTK